MVRRDKANYLIQSVSHSLDVIEELCKASGEMGVTELSKRLKLHKNNVFRLLATLELRGYVEQNASTENYRLGVKALQLGQAYVVQSSLVNRITPVLRTLSEETGETVSFAVMQNALVHYPVSIESKRAVRVNGRVATSVNAKSCAVGRLLLAQLPDSVIAELITGDTPQDAAIKNSLSELRSTGIIMDRGAIEADVLTIAKVVKGNGSDIVGAIEILAPQYRSKVEVLTQKIEEVSQALATTLGQIQPRVGLAGSIDKEVNNQSSNIGLIGKIR